jgi:hypothetical protein
MDVRLRQLADVLFAQVDIGAIVPERIPAKLLPHVFIFDIERGDRTPRLRVRLAGTAIDQIVGRSTVGHALEEFIHGPRGAQVIAGFHSCANTRKPIWMRQVVQIEKKPSRFVEGIAIYLAPERICGGLVGGNVALQSETAFESEVLTRSK